MIKTLVSRVTDDQLTELSEPSVQKVMVRSFSPEKVISSVSSALTSIPYTTPSRMIVWVERLLSSA